IGGRGARLRRGLRTRGSSGTPADLHRQPRFSRLLESWHASATNHDFISGCAKARKKLDPCNPNLFTVSAYNPLSLNQTERVLRRSLLYCEPIFARTHPSRPIVRPRSPDQRQDRHLGEWI